MPINPLQAPMNYLTQQPDFSQSFSGLAQIMALNRKSDQEEALKKAYAEDLRATLANPTPQAFSALTLKYPQQREAFKQSWEMLSTEQQNDEFKSGVEIYQAARTGNSDVAARLLDDRIAATENAGGDAKQLKRIRESIVSDPKEAAAMLALVTSSVDPEKWGKIFAEQRASEKGPAELTEAQAKAQKAAVDAKFAESGAVMDLQKKGWDITKIQEDITINRANARIAAMNAAANKEGNDLKRDELTIKIEDAKKKRDDAVREKAADAQAAFQGFDNAISVIDRLKNNPELDTILGSVQGAKFFPNTLVALVTPGTDSDKQADALADIENIQSQSFINNLLEAKAKGATFGALTDREGDRLIGFVRNLGTKQSEKQFKDNLSEVQRLLLKSRKTLAEKTGVPETIPDTPDAAPGADEIDALLKKYGQ